MGKIIIDKERCKGCRLCCVTCPEDRIRLAEETNEKGYHFAIFLDQGSCSGCTMCGRICPDIAIEVYQ
jgi:2-oxoglutarate ferredoxin oxidoreductase subunit delta